VPKRSSNSCLPARREAPGGPRPDLIWSETLATAAKKWAEELARQNCGRGYDHEDQDDMGENLAWSKYNVQSFASAVRGWIDEKWQYRGEPVGKEARGKKVGHYTQVRSLSVRKTSISLTAESKELDSDGR